MLGEGDPCSNQASQIDSLCQPEKSNIQSYDTTTRGHYSNFGDTDARMDTFMNQYNKYQAEELGSSGSYQNDSVSNKGNTNSNESVTPTIVGHNGGGSPGGGGDNHKGGGSPGGGGDNHKGGGSPGGGGDNQKGNNNQNNSPDGGGKSSTCTPVTLSDLPGQTKPLAICLFSGQDTNIATEIGLGTFTLVQLNGDEYQLTINNLNGQTQPAIVTVALGATSPITIPGLGTGNVLIGSAYSVILDVPRTVP